MRSPPLRFLFTLAGGRGHLDPLVPIARAAEAAGHAVAFSARPWMRAQIEALGFTVFTAGSDAGLEPVRRPLARVDAEREIAAAGAGFGGRIARERARDLLPQAKAWKPDALVCEELDFGAMVVAERLGVPHATVLVIAAGGFVRPDAVAPHLDAVRAEHGLAPDPALRAPARHLVLSPFPPRFRDPADPLPATAHAIRLGESAPARGAVAPTWLAEPSALPTIYFTLGTIFPLESGDLFARVLSGLRELPVRLVVTVGADLDPAELGPQPAHVRIERFVPQAAILPHCALAVSHGGSGSVLGALAHGLPMLLIPLGADQPRNAARCDALGVARTIDALAASPEDVRVSAASVLADPTLRRHAERLCDEIAAFPGPEDAVALLERIVAPAHRGLTPSGSPASPTPRSLPPGRRRR